MHYLARYRSMATTTRFSNICPNVSYRLGDHLVSYNFKTSRFTEAVFPDKLTYFTTNEFSKRICRLHQYL